MIRIRHLAAVATAAVLAVGLTACGASSKAGAPAADTKSSSSAKAPALRLGYFPNFTHAPAIVGAEKGLFQKELGATKLTTNLFDAGPAASEALLSGSIDAAFIGPGPTTNAYVKSKAIEVIAGAAANGAELVVKPSITSVAQLKGKKLATPQLANTQDIALRHYLKQNHLTATATGGGDVSIEPQANGDAVKAFQQGQIDGAWVPEPYATIMQKAGGKVLVDERSLWPDHRFVVTNLVVTKDFASKYPGSVTDLLKGLLDAEDAIAKDPAGAQTTTNAVLEKVTGKQIDPAVLKTAWSNVEFTVDPVAGSLVEGAKHAQDVGLLTGTVDLKGLYDLGPLNALLKAKGKAEVKGE
ncbi:ABC transporter substrate-binding protein [Amnibacterium sp. CER49]|uniref:ABC transporter substrate-binding protein n=1 Tax=Amnibacterium sp. CER49 TaxID=3039161 RepID=UPI00244D20B7|nr:ABC transporter substrate-binding protein [Amnibacterium sp. CER49]MDH2444520.1 ABC transporter substrate-binding protein [Amnibacterium sp. CER49]